MSEGWQQVAYGPGLDKRKGDPGSQTVTPIEYRIRMTFLIKVINVMICTSIVVYAIHRDRWDVVSLTHIGFGSLGQRLSYAQHSYLSYLTPCSICVLEGQ